jgi:hypothetical protein
VQAPSLLELTPQTEIPVEVGIRPPREANLLNIVGPKKEQTVCQPVTRNSQPSTYMKGRELGRQRRASSRKMPSPTYKIPQVSPCPHPFFGRDTPVTSMLQGQKSRAEF